MFSIYFLKPTCDHDETPLPPGYGTILVRYLAEAAADAPSRPITRSELQGRGSAADRMAARGSRPRKATSPRRPFHGHVCSQRAPAPFLAPPLALRHPMRQRAPQASARPPPAEEQRAAFRSLDVARPCVRRSALFSTLPPGSCAQGGPTRRFGGFVRKGTSPEAINAASFAARALTYFPPVTQRPSSLRRTPRPPSLRCRPSRR